MLLQLEISNIALIEYICIDFENGMNVLTGETGAGKSIIIDSINAVLGRRTTRELIRTGCESASVTAVYNFSSENIAALFEENGVISEEDGTIIIYREFNLQGRNICRINGKIVPLSLLKKAGEYLVDIHGQHDNQSLLDVSRHIGMLDSFAHEKLYDLKKAYSEKLAEYKKLRYELDKLRSDTKERQKGLDLLEYQIEEIKRADLKQNEEEELSARKNILASAEKIKTNLNSAYGKLYDTGDGGLSSYDSLSDACANIENLYGIDERYKVLSEKIREISYQLYDVIEEIRKEKDNIEFEPGEFDDIEDRLAMINEFKRKYGKNIPSVLQYLLEAEEEYKRLYNFEESSNAMEDEIKICREDLAKISGQITEVRREAARLLEEKIVSHFNDLEMSSVCFKADLQETGDFMPEGKDLVEFLVSTNPGEPLKSLAKIASGGEMSRIMLAIKAVLANIDNIPTMIFDEIDIGISGAAAARVGEKMAMISKQHQVLCVTHIARIAAYADNNILIEKSFDGENTKTHIRKLSGGDLVREIARLLDGVNYSETSMRHAQEMLETSKNF